MNDDTEKTISVVDRSTFHFIRRLEHGHSGKITFISNSADGMTLTASDDCTIRIFDINMTCTGTLRGHEGPIRKMWTIEGDRVLSVSDDLTIRMWNMNTFECEQVYKRHAHDILDVIYVAEMKQLVSVDKSGTEICWNENGDIISVINDHGCLVTGIIKLNTLVYLTCSANPTPCEYMGMVIARDIRTFRAVKVWKFYSPILSISVGPDHSTLMATAMNGSILRASDFGDWVEVNRENHPIEYIHIEPNGKKIICFSDNKYRKATLAEGRHIPVIVLNDRIKQADGGYEYISLLSSGALMCSTGSLITVDPRTKFEVKSPVSFSLSNPNNEILFTVDAPWVVEKWKLAVESIRDVGERSLVGLDRSQIISHRLFDIIRTQWVMNEHRVSGKKVSIDIMRLIKSFI